MSAPANGTVLLRAGIADVAIGVKRAPACMAENRAAP